MDKLDRLRFVQLMEGLMQIFQKQIETKAVDFYWQVLEPYTFETVQRACFKIINEQTDPFLPVPAKIKEVCEAVRPYEYQQLPAPAERPLTEKESSQYAMSCAFTVYCIQNEHTPGGPMGGVDDWCRERDQFTQDVAAGRIKLSRRPQNKKDKRSGTLIIQVIEDNLKKQTI